MYAECDTCYKSAKNAECDMYLYSNGVPSCLSSSPFHRRRVCLASCFSSFIIMAHFSSSSALWSRQIKYFKLFFARRPVWRRCRLVLARGRRAEKPAQIFQKDKRRAGRRQQLAHSNHIIRQGRDETSERGWGSIAHCASIPFQSYISSFPGILPLCHCVATNEQLAHL